MSERITWFRHSPLCTHYLTDGECTCEELLMILDSPSLEDKDA
jgi:hypothetical protein